MTVPSQTPKSPTSQSQTNKTKYSLDISCCCHNVPLVIQDGVDFVTPNSVPR